MIEMRYQTIEEEKKKKKGMIIVRSAGKYEDRFKSVFRRR